MLVLTRKQGESIDIGNGHAIITIVRLSGGQVRIGIEAERGVNIRRSELPMDDSKMQPNGRESRKDAADMDGS